MRFCALLLLVLLAPVLAFASQSSDTPATAKIGDVPHFDTLTETQFEAQTEPHTATPASLCDKKLAYSMRLPKGWLKTASDRSIINPIFRDERNGCPDEKVNHLGLIARYFAPETKSVKFPTSLTIQAIEFDKDTKLKEQFLDFIRKRKGESDVYNVLGVSENSDTQIEILFSFDRKGSSFVARVVAEIYGSRIILASYSVPKENWDEEQAMQEKVVKSFRLLNPEQSLAPPASDKP